MIHPFDLGDLLLVYRLQKRGVWLDPRHALAGAELPAWAALSAPFRWRGGGVLTYVGRGGGGGIIQMRLRPSRPEADIAFLAPGPECTREVAALWGRLLTHCVRQAGSDRVQRLFASIPEEAREMLAQFCQVGFAPYAREEVYLQEEPSQATVPPGGCQVRPATAADGWALQRLHAAITPRLVQQAEGAGGKPPDSRPPSAWEAGRGESLVLVRDGEIAALLLVQPGRSGHCLSLWGDFRNESDVKILLERGLASLAAHSRRPVYCLLPEYQSGVRVALGEQGFQLLTTWSCLVKHTVVRAREPARRPWVASPARPEPSVPGAMPSAAVVEER
jgi:hypothetical protein